MKVLHTYLDCCLIFRLESFFYIEWHESIFLHHHLSINFGGKISFSGQKQSMILFSSAKFLIFLLNCIAENYLSMFGNFEMLSIFSSFKSPTKISLECKAIFISSTCINGFFHFFLFMKLICILNAQERPHFPCECINIWCMFLKQCTVFILTALRSMEPFVFDGMKADSLERKKTLSSCSFLFVRGKKHEWVLIAKRDFAVLTSLDVKTKAIVSFRQV